MVEEESTQGTVGEECFSSGRGKLTVIFELMSRSSTLAGGEIFDSLGREMTGGQGKVPLSAFGGGETEGLCVAEGKIMSIGVAGDGRAVRGFGEEEGLSRSGGR
jgi:hypothetical protein